MTRKGRQARGAFVALVAGLSIMAAEQPSLRAAELNSLVPGDCEAFVTVRLAAVLEKAGVETGILPSWVEEREKVCGIPLLDVERCTVVHFDRDHEPIWLVHSSRPLPHKTIKAAIPDVEEIQHEGKTFLVSKEGDRAIHFLGERLFVAGSKDEVSEWLKRTGKKKEVTPTLEEALAQVDRHDLVAWGRIGVVPLSDKVARLGIRSGTAFFDVGE